MRHDAANIALIAMPICSNLGMSLRIFSPGTVMHDFAYRKSVQVQQTVQLYFIRF